MPRSKYGEQKDKQLVFNKKKGRQKKKHLNGLYAFSICWTNYWSNYQGLKKNYRKQQSSPRDIIKDVRSLSK